MTTTNAGQVAGYACLYGVQTEIVEGRVLFREEVAPGAFDNLMKARKHQRTTFVRDHDPGRLLGRVNAGTLRLATDRVGLRMHADLPETELGRETRLLVDRGDISGMSFAFRVAKDTWYQDDNRVAIRVIEEISELFDVAAVTWPAYEATSIWVARPGLRSNDSRWALHALKAPPPLPTRRAPLSASRAALYRTVRPLSRRTYWPAPPPS